MEVMRAHWTRFGAFLCFVVAAALMIASLTLTSNGRHSALDMRDVPIELASAA